ncbi:hypothetical protein HZB03_03180 [Candidatus Woesearchaeota archaeon]|nr:hypothetical protein [Candidatus Woesearchaeota archaeon]
MCSNCHAPWETGPVHGSFDYLGGSHGVDLESGIVIPYSNNVNPNQAYSKHINYY